MVCGAMGAWCGVEGFDAGVEERKREWKWEGCGMVT